jgi:hypothetical protein
MKKNGEPTWPAVSDMTVLMSLFPGTKELGDQPRSVIWGEIVDERVNLLQPTMAQCNATRFCCWSDHLLPWLTIAFAAENGSFRREWPKRFEKLFNSESIACREQRAPFQADLGLVSFAVRDFDLDTFGTSIP